MVFKNFCFAFLLGVFFMSANASGQIPSHECFESGQIGCPDLTLNSCDFHGDEDGPTLPLSCRDLETPDGEMTIAVATRTLRGFTHRTVGAWVDCGNVLECHPEWDEDDLMFRCVPGAVSTNLIVRETLPSGDDGCFVEIEPDVMGF